jgi:hypothetical protein
LFQIIEDIGNAEASYEPRRQSERFGKTLLWLITDIDTGKQTMMFDDDYDEVFRRFAEDNDINLLDERSKHITRFYIRRVGSVPRRSRPFVESMSQSMMTEDSTVNFDGGSSEPLTEGVGESPYKRRREEPIINIQNLRPWDKVILLEQLVSDRDEREAQRRHTIPGTTGLRRAAETPLDDDRPFRRMRPWESTENPPQEPLPQRRTVVPGTSGLRRDPDYSRPAGGTRRPSKVLKK